MIMFQYCKANFSYLTPRPAGWLWVDHANTRPRPAHSLTQCFNYFKFNIIESLEFPVPALWAHFVRGFIFYQTTVANPTPQIPSLVGVRVRVQVCLKKYRLAKQPLLTDYSQKQGALYCVPQKLHQGLALFAFILKWIDTKFNINWKNASISNHLGLVLGLGPKNV